MCHHKVAAKYILQCYQLVETVTLEYLSLLMVIAIHSLAQSSETHLAAQTFVDACDCFHKEANTCQEREGGAGNNQPWTVPPSGAGQTRQAGGGLWAQMTRLGVTHN